MSVFGDLDHPDAEWCPECQRCRVSCAHQEGR